MTRARSDRAPLLGWRCVPGILIGDVAGSRHFRKGCSRRFAKILAPENILLGRSVSVKTYS
jgi:hypothetical protein